MDINYLLAREQTSIVRASQALSAPARLSHLGLASAYRTRIAALARAAGVCPAPPSRPILMNKGATA